MAELKPIVDQIYLELISVTEDLVEAKGLAGLGSIISTVIKKVEMWRSSTGELTGQEKKKVASEVLNKLVNLPVIPEWIESKVFDLVIDWFVDFFNRSFGKKWRDAVANLPF